MGKVEQVCRSKPGGNRYVEKENIETMAHHDRGTIV